MIIHFYPGIDTALQMDVLSREQKLEQRSCSLLFYIILQPGVLVSSWSVLEEAAALPSL